LLPIASRSPLRIAELCPLTAPNRGLLAAPLAHAWAWHAFVASGISCRIASQVIGSFIFLNLIVAVILENFTSLYFVSPDLVSASDLELFSEAWAEFDPDATNYMALAKVPELLINLPRPLGVKGKTLEVARTLCYRLRVPQQNGCVAYHDLLEELIENNYFRTGADAFNEDTFKIMPERFTREVAILPPKIPPPEQPPRRRRMSQDLLGEKFMAPTAASNATIAEAFAFGKMYSAKTVFLASLDRARSRIKARKEREKLGWFASTMGSIYMGAAQLLGRTGYAASRPYVRVVTEEGGEPTARVEPATANTSAVHAVLPREMAAASGGAEVEALGGESTPKHRGQQQRMPVVHWRQKAARRRQR
jgi:hypothetical protein